MPLYALRVSKTVTLLLGLIGDILDRGIWVKPLKNTSFFVTIFDEKV